MVMTSHMLNHFNLKQNRFFKADREVVSFTLPEYSKSDREVVSFTMPEYSKSDREVVFLAYHNPEPFRLT